MQSDKAKFKKEFVQRLVGFSLRTIKLCEGLRQTRNLSSVADQLIRSATSVGANVVEAKGTGSAKNHIRFFEIALRSANETKCWLIIKEAAAALKVETEGPLTEADELFEDYRFKHSNNEGAAVILDFRFHLGLWLLDSGFCYD